MTYRDSRKSDRRETLRRKQERAIKRSTLALVENGAR